MTANDPAPPVPTAPAEFETLLVEARAIAERAYTPYSRFRVGAAALAEDFGRIPVHVVACADTTGRDMGGNQASLWGSVLPAAWSYMLAARALGLAAAWTTVLLDAEREVAEVLGLPPGIRIGAVLPTAYPLGDGFRPARRDDWTAHVHEERW